MAAASTGGELTVRAAARPAIAAKGSQGRWPVTLSAVDLLLGILRRDLTKGGELDVLGDGTVWTGWLTRTPY
jgi:hypothetical protein